MHVLPEDQTNRAFYTRVIERPFFHFLLSAVLFSRPLQYVLINEVSLTGCIATCIIRQFCAPSMLTW